MVNAPTTRWWDYGGSIPLGEVLDITDGRNIGSNPISSSMTELIL